MHPCHSLVAFEMQMAAGGLALTVISKQKIATSRLPALKD